MKRPNFYRMQRDKSMSSVLVQLFLFLHVHHVEPEGVTKVMIWPVETRITDDPKCLRVQILSEPRNIRRSDGGAGEALGFYEASCVVCSLRILILATSGELR